MEHRIEGASMPISGVLEQPHSSTSPPGDLTTAWNDQQDTRSIPDNAGQSHQLPTQPPTSSHAQDAPSQEQDASRIQPNMDSMQGQPRGDANANKLAFFQRYFTRPADSSKDPEKHTSNDRRFSFLSIGFLLSAAILAMVLIAAIVAAVVLTVDRGHKKVEAQEVDHPDSPIRSAIPSNFPDPALLYEKGVWYAFATTNAAGVLAYKDGSNNVTAHTTDFGLANIQMATSNNFVNWTLADLAEQPLAQTGNWTMGAHKNSSEAQKPKISSTWAPAVIKRADGKYVMYYAALPYDKKNPYEVQGKDGKPHSPHPFPHCVGAAVSQGDSPLGPYDPLDDYVVCPKPEGGAIDPEVWRDENDTIWLTYKVDGNNIGHGGFCGNTVDPIVPTPIMLQQMDKDGITKVGDPVQILTNDPSDGPLIEAPMLMKSPQGVWFLFFSSGCTRENSYVVKYATARDIKGPYTRAEGKLLKTGDWGLEAPGSVGITEDGSGGWNMAFHARVNYEQVGRVRAMYTTKLEFHDTIVKMVRDNSTVHLGHNNR